MSITSILDRERIIAPMNYNRWLVPPAALSIHLAIGQAYGFSGFNLPMTKLFGVTQSTPEDWKLTQLGWIFTIAIVFLGLSAAAFGHWLEDAGPRKAMFAAACCFGGGFIISSFGVSIHNLWVIYLGYGVLGGIGLGLGYISPVSTLIKWFPDRPGMATGLAIMGFGGGAMIASPLSATLMTHYRTAASTGVAPTFVTLGVAYFVYMLFGVFTVRLPAAGWAPPGYVPPAASHRMITTANVAVSAAVRTTQFWLLWVMLCFNVTAGIGILEQASPMIQEMFNGRVTAAAAAGFVGLLSIANMAGRFLWSSLSDYIGRPATYATFFALGAVLYWLIPGIGEGGRVWLFVLVAVVVISMYGGGFATIPAYLRDLFGTMQVGAIHGRLLTAWSAAGIFGPLLVNYIREAQIQGGIHGPDAYRPSMHLMTLLLVIGFVANVLVRPVDERYHFRGETEGSGTAAAPYAAGAPTGATG